MIASVQASGCASLRATARSKLLPPPNRNRLLPISIALLSGRNPRIRGFGLGRVGVGGREVVAKSCRLSRPPPPTPPHKGEERSSRHHDLSSTRPTSFKRPADAGVDPRIP